MIKDSRELIKIDKNGTKFFADYRCTHCGGAGGLMRGLTQDILAGNVVEQGEGEHLKSTRNTLPNMRQSSTLRERRDGQRSWKKKRLTSLRSILNFSRKTDSIRKATHG